MCFCSIPADLVAASERWGVQKPDPAFFARLAAEAGAPAAQIAYVGDRLDNDVLPARAAGMRAIFIRRGPWGHIHATWPERAQAHAVIATLAELPGLGDRAPPVRGWVRFGRTTELRSAHGALRGRVRMATTR